MIIYQNEKYSFILTPDGGELFQDHSPQQRGGHLGHAMTECNGGDILCFYANCAGHLGKGHSGHGWMEYKRSIDGGKTWGNAEIYPYSKQLYDMDFGITAMAEKAVVADNGNILVFHLLCDIAESKGGAWGEHPLATYAISYDNGVSFPKYKRLSDECGRIYDAAVHSGKIYVLMEHGKTGYCDSTEYHLYVSEDCGETFQDLSTLPFYGTAELHRYYGTFEWLDKKTIICYTYCQESEFQCNYAISKDCGKTWSELQTTEFKLGIRNPQLVKFKDAYFMFGRSWHDAGDFVVYCSDDGMKWDEGHIVKKREHGLGAYSNTLPLGRFSENGITKVLVQASHAYDESRTNIYHWELYAEERNDK